MKVCVRIPTNLRHLGRIQAICAEHVERLVHRTAAGHLHAGARFHADVAAVAVVGDAVFL